MEKNAANGKFEKKSSCMKRGLHKEGSTAYYEGSENLVAEMPV
jgi:hypothetical protein